MQMGSRSFMPQRAKSWEYAQHLVAHEQQLWNPDEILEVNRLHAEEDGTLVVPNIGAVALTPWSRQQLASALGVRWPRWFENITGAEAAEEINRRLERAEGVWKLRTRQPRMGEDQNAQVLGAIVSKTYTPIADGRVLQGLAQAVDREWLAELRVFQSDFTDRSMHLGVLNPTPVVIGAGSTREEFYTGFYIRNSQVGFTALTIHIYFLRLVCTNGLLATDGEFCLLYRTHRPASDDILCALISNAFRRLEGCWQAGLHSLDNSRGQPVEQVGEEISTLLKRVPGFVQYKDAVRESLEPDDNGLFASRFGVAQALTQVAKSLPHPDQRFEMERLAGNWLFNGVSQTVQ